MKTTKSNNKNNTITNGLLTEIASSNLRISDTLINIQE